MSRQPDETRQFEDDGVTWLAELFAPTTPMGGIGVPPGFNPKHRLQFSAPGRTTVKVALPSYEPLASMPLERLRQLRASGILAKS